MLYEMPKQTIIAMPGRSIQTISGISLTIIIPSPQCVADGHSHIENGACAPLPLLWDKSWLIRGKTRKQIDDSSTKGLKGTLFSMLKGEAGPVQVMSTFDIGTRAVNDNKNAFAVDTLIGKSKLYGSPIPDSKARDFYSFLIILMMDMEYAHIAGLYGQTIYHEDESPWYYYERKSGLLEENKGKKILLPGENQLTFAKFAKQLRETSDAAKTNPLRLFPMYFYAPQRWKDSKSTPFDRKRICGSWDYPFSQIATLKNKGIFLGFKMYNPLGSQPLDPRLPYLHDKTLEGDCFYARCEREGIPIMAHCSPGGMTTHELKYFMDHDSGRSPYQSQSQYSVSISAAPVDASTVAVDTEEMAIRHFYDNYVHPKAWRNVLQKYPKLKLCLAHFGGDEFKNGLNSTWVTEILALTEEFPNVYTDFSCWNMDDCKETLADLLTSLKYKHIREKLIFGTDWYMTLVALGGKSYKSFCEDAWEAFMEIPGGEKLWVNCTFLNPFIFYGFYDKDPQTGVSKLENISAALDAAKCDRTKLQDNRAFFKRLQKEYDKLIEERKKAKGV
jgi:predicted TIM-barrel fold metal-dependent hydrolase